MKRSTRIALLFVASAVLALVGILALYGGNLRRSFGASADSLAAAEAQPVPGSAPAAAPAPSKLAMKKKLHSFAAAPSGQPNLPRAVTGNTHVAERPNPFTLTSEDRFSTFAVDVDTASYTLFRRYVREGHAPPPEAVRVEEWVNYFGYRVPAPEKGDFNVDLEGAPSPFTPGRHLLKVGLQARRIGKSERKPTHLVFLVDTSGSMNSPDKLPLARHSMRLMLEGLNETDTVALVTYAGSVRDVLPPTPASERERILAAIDALDAGGGTAMGSGMELAYQHAGRKAGPHVVSRVVVLTDGDANIGPDLDADAMLKRVGGYVQEGVTLSTIGFGMGNYRDNLMERMANKGNGNCYYIDSEREARRVFQERLAGTLEVLAKDVKVQVEFDPAAVRGYRLLGYENRAIADQDFRDDKVDAGEVGPGHSVTALYEVELTGEAARVATVRVRAKAPSGVEAAERTFGFERAQLRASLEAASADLRFAAAVAGTADILRGAPQAEGWSLATAEALAEGALDGFSERQEFLTLLREARRLRASGESSSRATPY
ncbi:von Willebrand factor type A domain-containing protein [Myxococcaceae bacterium GXIMD 01537]